MHVWAEHEWAEVVAGCISELGQTWALVDVLNNRDVPGSLEFGMVLRKDTAALRPAVRRQRFTQVYADLGPPGTTLTAGGDLEPSASTACLTADEESRAAVLEVALAQSRQDARNWQALAEERGEKLRADRKSVV